MLSRTHGREARGASPGSLAPSPPFATTPPLILFLPRIARHRVFPSELVETRIEFYYRSSFCLYTQYAASAKRLFTFSYNRYPDTPRTTIACSLKNAIGRSRVRESLAALALYAGRETPGTFVPSLIRRESYLFLLSLCVTCIYFFLVYSRIIVSKHLAHR